jgi:hypothetical protein
MLSKQVYQSVSAGHLWFSIFSRPPSSLIFNCMNMFISIINNRFRILRQNLAQAVNEDHEIFTIIFRKFKRWTDSKKLSRSYKNISYVCICI